MIYLFLSVGIWHIIYLYNMLFSKYKSVRPASSDFQTRFAARSTIIPSSQCAHHYSSPADNYQPSTRLYLSFAYGYRTPLRIAMHSCVNILPPPQLSCTQSHNSCNAARLLCIVIILLLLAPGLQSIVAILQQICTGTRRVIQDFCALARLYSANELLFDYNGFQSPFLLFEYCCRFA